MRLDSRKSDELRAVTFERGYTKHAAGSVLVSFGDTKVLCTASFAEQVPPWRRGQGEGWVTAEYAMLPGSSQERVRREAAQRGRAQEISRLIGRSIRAVVDLKAMGECMITLDCDVLQADGGTRTASVTGAFVALYDALDKSVRAGNLREVPIHGCCAAISVGVVDGCAMLDLCYAEDVRAEVDMNVVMNESGEFIEVQGSAEKRTFSQARLAELIALAAAGNAKLVEMQKELLGLA